jgi:hypothetical protein
MNAKRLVWASGIVLACYVFASLMFPIHSSPVPRILQAKNDIAGLEAAISRYKVTYGSVPRGSNAEIVKQLTGDNPQKICFLSARSLSQTGELIDPWGKPYAITYSSDAGVLVRSSGKDRVLGNADDILFNTVSNSFVSP